MIIGVGCDIVELKRVQLALEKPGFLRILTAEERSLYNAIPAQRQVEWLAGRFAAKEAVIKALSVRKELLLSQISILYQEKQPVCHIEGYDIHLSIAHERTHAIAYAIAEVS